MQRIDGPTASAGLPAPAATGSGASAPGYFAHPDLLAGTAATTLDPDWANMIQEELVGVIAHANLSLDKSNHGQLLQALLATFVAQGGASGIAVGATEATIPLPGGFEMKIGTVAGTFTEGVLSHNFDAPFPSKCWVVIPVVINASGGGSRDVWAQRETLAAAGFSLFIQWTGQSGTTNSIDGVDYIAIGN